MPQETHNSIEMFSYSLMTLGLWIIASDDTIGSFPKVSTGTSYKLSTDISTNINSVNNSGGWKVSSVASWLSYDV